MQTRRRRKSEQSCRQALLLVSDWSPQEEMVHSFIVPIYTSSPDLRQVQIYTRSRFTAATDLHQSHGLCLRWHQAAPLWRHFILSQRLLINCQVFSPQILSCLLFPGIGQGLVGRVWLWCLKWPDTQIPPRPPPSL